MVVDDDPALLGFTCKYLSRLGYSVVPYRSSEEAWRQFQTPGVRFSLVLIDQSMPVISGEQLLRMMLSVEPGVRSILTSGYPSKRKTCSNRAGPDSLSPQAVHPGHAGRNGGSPVACFPQADAD